jgi:hypothetical protein
MQGYVLRMATWDDVRRIALSLPETSEGPHFRRTSWKVKDKAFIWERPLSDRDMSQLTELGEQVPDGEIMGARVENELAKEVLIENEPEVFFTIPHFRNYPAILTRLDTISEDLLYETIVEAWLDRAPDKLAQEFLEQRGT